MASILQMYGQIAYGLDHQKFNVKCQLTDLHHDYQKFKILLKLEKF